MSSPTDALLLVEDNPDDVALILRAFRLAKLKNPVSVARDGVEALEVLFGEAAQPLPILIILDLNLPRVDGMGVLRAIRKHSLTHLIPVLMLSSSTLDPDIEACYGLGANSYLVKPIDFNQFIVMVSQLTNYWLTMNRAAPLQVRT